MLDRVSPEIWFGRPGSLVSLPPPDPGVESARIRPKMIQDSGSSHSVSTSSYGRRAWNYVFTGLPDDEYVILDSHESGVRGVGPWALLDPSYPNKAFPNQASGTDALADASGFSLPAGVTAETISSSTQYTANYKRSLAWTAPATPASGLLHMKTPWPRLLDDYWGYPVTPSTQVVAGIRARATQVDGARLVMRFHDAAQSIIATTTPSYANLSTSAFADFTVTATGGSTAAWVSLTFQINPSDVATATTVYLGGLQLLYGTGAITTWVPGNGVPMVSFSSFRANPPMYGRHDIEVSLVEVGTNA